MARAFNRRGWDALAWNFRGCSGEPNRLLRSYHSGATEDLAEVVAHAGRGGAYDRAAVVGFSLGGNLTLKFLGELGASPGLVCGGAGISVPCDLRAAALKMTGPDCAFYMRRFIRDMGDKMRAKAHQFPGRVDLAPLVGMTTFQQFDDAFTGPMHGFRDAEDYWARCSAKPFLPHVRVPTLIVSAADDPFLAPECFPVAEADGSGWVTLDAPKRGGHVGFVSAGPDYWSERRTAEFLSAL
jgi:predicted alpha/beta-fold hydrolase